MELGMIGLGKMGYNLVLNLLSHDHQVVVNDADHSQIKKIADEGAVPAFSLKEVVEKLAKPRTVWVMVPAGEITDQVIEELSDMMDEGDTIIDGGNSNYKHTLEIKGKLDEKKINFVDAGTSGGVDGARYGACFMVGGPDDVMKKLEPVFVDVAVQNGFIHTGETGSGHYLKMIHNGIEYGMMQSIAEGFDVLEKCQFDYDYEKVANVWNHGSVIRSWLMELTENAFSKDPKLDEIAGIVNSSGEGKWTVEAALQEQVATPVIALSLMMRYRSQEQDTFSGKLLSALRNEFGGHEVVKANK